MNLSLVTKSIRNLIFKNNPYFAHFCVTQRCNLRCRYCQVWEKKLEELNTIETKRVIDILNAMGVAMLSITGGEPLLREDIEEIIEYAKTKKMYVRLTSNGTLPIKRYKKLLTAQSLDSVSISLDGVDGDDLPFSKVSPKILNTIDFVYKNKGKIKFSLSCLLHKKNREDIKKIVRYIKKYPGLKLFVQPIVVGTGDLRVSTEEKVDPLFLKNLKTTTPDFFIDACYDYYNSKKYNWSCKAGKLFFDIKPNGDFWICQDFPTKLNILDKDFIYKWKSSDFSTTINRCNGCTYSCYFLTQKSMELKNIPNFIKFYNKYKKQ